MLADTHVEHQDTGSCIDLWGEVCREWLSRYIPPDASVLRITRTGCHLDEGAVASLRQLLEPSPNLPQRADLDTDGVSETVIEGLRVVPAATIDRIVAVDVLGRLADERALRVCLRSALRVLRPGGKFIVMQPNCGDAASIRPGLCGQSLGSNDREMSAALARSGFEVEQVKARLLPYTSTGPSLRLMVSGRPISSIAPVHRILGGQMFIVAAKPSGVLKQYSASRSARVA